MIFRIIELHFALTKNKQVSLQTQKTITNIKHIIFSNRYTLQLQLLLLNKRRRQSQQLIKDGFCQTVIALSIGM